MASATLWTACRAASSACISSERQHARTVAAFHGLNGVDPDVHGVTDLLALLLGCHLQVRPAILPIQLLLLLLMRPRPRNVGTSKGAGAQGSTMRQPPSQQGRILLRLCSPDPCSACLILGTQMREGLCTLVGQRAFSSGHPCLTSWSACSLARARLNVSISRCSCVLGASRMPVTRARVVAGKSPSRADPHLLAGPAAHPLLREAACPENPCCRGDTPQCQGRMCPTMSCVGHRPAECWSASDASHPESSSEDAWDI
jgi:hypothetical protein